MCVLRDYFSAIIGQLLNHYPPGLYTRLLALKYLYYKISLSSLYSSMNAWHKMALLVCLTATFTLYDHIFAYSEVGQF